MLKIMKQNNKLQKTLIVKYLQKNPINIVS